MYTSIIAIALVAAPLVSAHGLIASATGNLGGKGQGLGLNAGGENNEGDVTVFKTGAFGATGAGGAIDPNKDIASMIAQTGSTIPQVSASNGILTLVYHQINADGAGPISCSVSADATGKTFVPLKVTTNVPGNNGRSNAADEDFPLVAQLPAGTKCTGKVGGLTGVCIVKCENPVGPFGGNVPVQQGGVAAASAKAAKLPAKVAQGAKKIDEVEEKGKQGKGKDEKKGKDKDEKKHKEEEEKKHKEEEEKKHKEEEEKKHKEEEEKKHKEEEEKKHKEEEEKKHKEEEERKHKDKEGKKGKEDKKHKEEEEKKHKEEEEKKHKDKEGKKHKEEGEKKSKGKEEKNSEDKEEKPKCVRAIEWTA